MGIYENMDNPRNRTSRPAGAPERTDSEHAIELGARGPACAINVIGNAGQATRPGAHSQYAATNGGAQCGR